MHCHTLAPSSSITEITSFMRIPPCLESIGASVCVRVCVQRRPILQFINHTQFVISLNHLFFLRFCFCLFFSVRLWLYSNCVFFLHIFNLNSCISFTRSLCYYFSLHIYRRTSTHTLCVALTSISVCLLARARSFVIYKRDFLCGNLEARNQL